MFTTDHTCCVQQGQHLCGRQLITVSELHNATKHMVALRISPREITYPMTVNNQALCTCNRGGNTVFLSPLLFHYLSI
jgi:hypothetical protein